MKKIVILGMLMLCSGISHAGCILGGTICLDEQLGLTIQGRVTNSAGEGIPTLTLAQVATTTPKQAGQLVFVSDAVSSFVCVSSGTGIAAYIAVSLSTGTVSAGSKHCN